MQRVPAPLFWLVAVVLDLVGTSGAGAQQGSFHADLRKEAESPAIVEDSDKHVLDSDLVQREVQLFYRDLGTRQWNDVQNHFWPAKIAARWPPPFHVSEESRTGEPPEHSSGAAPVDRRHEGLCDDSGRAASGRISITFVGRWARVTAEPCTDGRTAGPRSDRFEELWLLQFEGAWKIVYVR
jgi:hypothetical protein